MKFSLPFIVLGSGIFFLEFYIFTKPSIFKLKADHFKENKSKIDGLILGSSHNMEAINPEYVNSFHFSNLAMGSQDIRIDSTLFESSIAQLPQLKFVIFELSYHTLEFNRTTPNYSRNSFYLRFHNINLFEREVSIKDYSVILPNPKLFVNFIFREKTLINKFGFITAIPSHYGLSRFKKLNYNENIILKDTANILITRHKNENIVAYYKNTKAIDYMINICVQKKIIPIVIATPVYKNYYQSYLPSKETRRKNYILQFIKKYPSSIFLNYEQDPRFKVTDFKNEDHLNPRGAEKFSKILNDTLLAIKPQTLKKKRLLKTSKN